jgi:hypothetical protein
MSQVFILDEGQLSALRRAINQIMRASAEINDPTRDEVVHAVFVAAKNGEFDPVELVRRARENLAMRPVVKGKLAEPRPARRTGIVAELLT